MKMFYGIGSRSQKRKKWSTFTQKGFTRLTSYFTIAYTNHPAIAMEDNKCSVFVSDEDSIELLAVT